MGAGVIISETQPSEMTNRYSWIKPCSDGKLEFYEPSDAGWVLVHTLTKLSLGTLIVTDHLYIDDKKGINQNVTVAGVGTFKFKKGVLIEFTPA